MDWSDALVDVWARRETVVVKAEWNEEDHPRDASGRFGAGDREAAAERLDEAGFGSEPGLERLGDPVFKTEADVKAWSESRGVEVHPDLMKQWDGFGLERTAIICGAYDDLVAKYPKLDGHVVRLDFDDMARSMAYTRHEGGQDSTVFFTKTLLKDLEGDGVDMGMKNGERFGVTRDLREITIHELGHALDNTVDYGISQNAMADPGFGDAHLNVALVDAGFAIQRGDWTEEQAVERTTDNRESLERFVANRESFEASSEENQQRITNMVADMTENPDKYLLLDRLKYGSANILMDSGAAGTAVSVYAATNPSEFYAETFAMFNSDEPMEERVGPSLTGEDRQKAIDRMNAYRDSLNKMEATLGSGRRL